MSDSLIRSLTPVGKTLGRAKERLEGPEKDFWREQLVARMWAEENRLRAFALTCLDEILHEHNKKCRPGVPDGCRYEPVSERDIHVASAVIQWLGSDNGTNFLDRYIKARDAEKKHRQTVFTNRFLEQMSKLHKGK